MQEQDSLDKTKNNASSGGSDEGLAFNYSFQSTIAFNQSSCFRYSSKVDLLKKKEQQLFDREKALKEQEARLAQREKEIEGAKLFPT